MPASILLRCSAAYILLVADMVDAFRTARRMTTLKGDCATVWDARTENGLTCGQRIESLTQQGVDESAAKRTVAEIAACGACAEEDAVQAVQAVRKHVEHHTQRLKSNRRRATPPSESPHKGHDGLYSDKGHSNRRRITWKYPIATPAGDAPMGDRSKAKSYTCEDDSAGKLQLGYTMTPIAGEEKRWFENMFKLSKEEAATLGKGQDVGPGRAPYSSLKFRGVWQVSGETDSARFAAAQEPTFKKTAKRYEQLITEQPHQASNGTAREQAAWAIRNDVYDMQTAIQKLDGYPDAMTHPTSAELNGTTTYFVHGTKPDVVPLIFCNGLRKGSSGLFGAALYLSDKVAKTDQYSAEDCLKTDGGNCSYVVDTMPSTSAPGFPESDAEFDRTKPVEYALVVLTSPFRMTWDYSIKNGKRGRQNERQLFWVPRKRRWVNFPFNYTEKTFSTPRPDSRSIFDKYQFVHGLARLPHQDVAAPIKAEYGRGWYPILDRFDEFFLDDAALTRVDYIMAYQRE